MMLQIALWPILCGCVLLVDAPMNGDEEFRADCSKPQTQMEINDCASRDFQAADQALNAQYRISRDALRKKDAAGGGTAEQALITAQRAWISARDEQCQQDDFASGGGSMAALEIANCKEELTRSRTQELKDLAESVGK